jgi:hypothetical protein
MSVEYICAPSLKIGATTYEIVDGSYKFDPEMHKIDVASSFFTQYTMGNAKVTITVKTNDFLLAKLCHKGTEHTDVELIFKRNGLLPGAAATPAAYTFAVGTNAFKISNARVVEGLDIGGDSSKKPSEFTITFEATRKTADNADPTVTVTFAGA